MCPTVQDDTPFSYQGGIEGLDVSYIRRSYLRLIMSEMSSRDRRRCLFFCLAPVSLPLFWSDDCTHRVFWDNESNNACVHPNIGSSRVRRRRPNPHRRPRVPHRLRGGAAHNVGVDALGNNSFPFEGNEFLLIPPGLYVALYWFPSWEEPEFPFFKSRKREFLGNS